MQRVLGPLVHVMICLASAMPGSGVFKATLALALLDFLVYLGKHCDHMADLCRVLHMVPGSADNIGQCALHSLMQAHPS